MMLLVASLSLTSAATAQGFRLDIPGTQKKMEASDADILNAKKAEKAATWATRGDVYYNAAIAPVAPLYRGAQALQLDLLVGRPTEAKEEVVRGQQYQVRVYRHFDLYMFNDQLIFWKQKTQIAPNGLDVAFEAYNKAAEIDPRQSEKMAAGIQKLVAQYQQEGDNNFSIGDFAAAAQAFAKAYEFSSGPLVNHPDTLSIFNAGYVAVLNQQYDDALKYLGIAEQLDFYGNDGELYQYQYLCYFNKGDMAAAEAVLRKGIQQFPSNSLLVESLVSLYTTTGRDASEIIPIVQEAQAKDPNNYVYAFGLGLIYNRLNDYSKAVEEFKKAVDLSPEDFASIFNVGLTYLQQADAMGPEINAIPFNDTALYNQKTGEFNALYKQAIPYLERAHALNNTDRTLVEIMRSIYFRFRDENPGMMQNYEKFNELLQNMPAE